MLLYHLRSKFLIGVVALLPSTSFADAGKPVAVRWWGQAMVSIETYWNLRIVVDPFSTEIGYDDPQLTGDLVLVTHEHHDHNNVALVGGEPIVARGLDDNGKVQPIYHVLDRLPNAEKPWWKDARQRIARSPHAAVVTSIPAWHDDNEGNQRGATAIFLIEVDGVRIAHCGDLGQPQLTDEQLAALGKVDVLCIAAGGVYTADLEQVAGIVRQINPRVVLPIHYKTPALKINLEGAQGLIAALKEECEVVKVKGNTLAVSAVNKRSDKSKIVVLDYEPWQLPSEWESLFVKKETSCRASQAVFAKLSINQMNFKPSNGTHTPRWNTEHMMGRELLFFSQIYAEKDPAIKVIDLNPKQMPPEYEYAHPKWTGAEEARQMERVLAFSRRFSYLLEGLELDKRAPGSRWTPRGLLKQMEWHYNDHTSNVIKKFELPDWPQE